jgi:hypothetical protein
MGCSSSSASPVVPEVKVDHLQFSFPEKINEKAMCYLLLYETKDNLLEDLNYNSSVKMTEVPQCFQLDGDVWIPLHCEDSCVAFQEYQQTKKMIWERFPPEKRRVVAYARKEQNVNDWAWLVDQFLILTKIELDCKMVFLVYFKAQPVKDGQSTRIKPQCHLWPKKVYSTTDAVYPRVYRTAKFQF